MSVPTECPDCKGEGDLEDGSECPRCEGFGEYYPEYEEEKE
jgi:DnaJ-class molecular chaperone